MVVRCNSDWQIKKSAMANLLSLPRKSVSPLLVACSARYQSDTAVAQYCDAHYGPDKFGVANFSKRIAQLCIMAQEGRPQRRALDLGCSVGRTTFELATRFDQATGIDYSDRFIEIARHLKRHGKIGYRLREDGELFSNHQVTLADFDLDMTTSRVTFSQGDVRCLAAGSGDYDLVLAANLIDRLPDPGQFLTEIHHRLVIDGLLVIASPYDWIERFTPRKRWLCHHLYCAGIPRTSLEGLSKKLTKHFTPVAQPQEMEFVIRDTARTFRHNISQVTLWRRIC